MAGGGNTDFKGQDGESQERNGHGSADGASYLEMGCFRPPSRTTAVLCAPAGTLPPQQRPS